MRPDRTSSQRGRRLERDANARRARARAHLARRRSNGDRRRSRGPRARRGVAIAAPRLFAAGALVGSLAAGLAFGDTALAALLDSLRGTPAAVDRIAVRGAQHLSPAEVASATGIAPGALAREVDVTSVEQQLTAHPWIASAGAVRMPGGALVVEVVEREPRARIDLGAAVWAVDGSGLAFAPADDVPLDALPHLVFAGELTPGEPNPMLAEAIRIAERLPTLGLALPVEVEIAAADDPEGFALRLPLLGARFIVGREEVDARLDDLVGLVARRPELVSGAALVDLRFADQAVLRMEPAPKGAQQVAPTRGSAPESAKRNARRSGAASPTG